MQKASISVDNGTIEFAYVDSGAPKGNAYTTLICVHGHTTHAHSFTRLFPHTQKHNTRIIALNRRDYAGSTPFSDADLAVLSNAQKDERALEKFLFTRGLEIARFIQWVIREKQIPKASADGKSGGIALLGWSMGNITTLAFLAYLRDYPWELVETLKPYLRTFIMHELPDNSIGYPVPDGYYNPLTDPSIKERMRFILFGTWCSSFYSHPAYTSNAPRTDFLTALQVRTPKKPRRPCTADTFAPTDILAMADPKPGKRSEPHLWALPLALLQKQKLKAFFVSLDDASASAVSQSQSQFLPLPSLRLHVMYCLESVWVVLWETWQLEREYTQWKEEGKAVRPVNFHPIESANHFLHWEEPERFLTICIEAIRS